MIARPTATPESQGVDSVYLLRLLDHAREQHINLHSLLIARLHGADALSGAGETVTANA